MAVKYGKSTKSKESKSIKMHKGGDAKFLDACTKADTPPTARQYKKWLRGIGAAKNATK